MKRPVETNAPGPRLAALIAAGLAWIEGFDVIGRAADGDEVLLGSARAFRGDLDSVESYLAEYPEPSQW